MSDLPLAPGAQTMMGRVCARAVEAGHDTLGIHHALSALLGSYAELARSVAGDATLPDAAGVERALAAGDVGRPVTEKEIVAAAGARAAARGAGKVFERDLATVILSMAAARDAAAADPGGAGATGATGGAGAGTPTAPAAPRPAAVKQPPPPVRWKPATKKPTPTLEKIARDLTKEAADGLVPPVLGRDEELDALIETVMRPTKRNALLVGPAGVGKTAIAEALARRIVAGEVPDPLRNCRLFALQVAGLTQGTKYSGSLEERLKQVVEEAEQEGVIVFLDEAHSAIGAGGGGTANDVANILKPALARGRMACIAATTDAEYEQFIVSDPAFERRFQPLRIQELSREATLGILKSRADDLAKDFGMVVAPEALELAVSMADRFMRNRFRPDKALDVFNQAVGRARATDSRALGSEVVAETVRRMVGVPVADANIGDRIRGLAKALPSAAGCTADAAERLCQRLSVTVRGVDLRPQRPNAVVLALSAEGDAGDLARTISAALFGEEAPLIDVDLSDCTHEADVTRLIGAPPGYVGFDVQPPLQQALAQRPWSVVLLRRPDLAHPAVQAALGGALREGFIKDQRGRKYFLSDTVVVMGVAAPEAGPARSIGFRTPGAVAEPAARPARGDDAGAWLEDSLAAAVSLVCRLGGGGGVIDVPAVRRRILAPIAALWARDQGVEVAFDDTVAEWLAKEATRRRCGVEEVERVFEEAVAPEAVAALAEAPRGARIEVTMRDGRAAAVTGKVADRGVAG